MRNIRLITGILTLLISFDLLADNCPILLPNSSAEVSTNTLSTCVKLKNLNYEKTYFVADPSFQKNADYNIKIETVAGITILDKNQLSNIFSTSAKLNTNLNTEIKIILTPITQDVKYRYSIIHDENTSTGETSIYIGLHSKKVKTFVDPPPCRGCEVNNTPIDTLINLYSHTMNSAVTSSAAEVS
ncbi:hypothetical protein Sden_3402 [Shewanella denitrificans OS217]|uniref:Uncharacterized protein n=2 Tax=Shewanella TaxID=22 RepID=Q12IP8_SHEDO|nr:hypothetical protein Sden_3402 [Shewanella denitrificans OS217]